MAWSSTVLLEFDFAAIEAVLTGWFVRDPTYMRLARLGIHAFVASHVLKRPADLSWPDDQLAAYFKAIKGSEDEETHRIYNGAKRVVHATNYGQTAMGTYLGNLKLFPTLKAAEQMRETYFACAPTLPIWHTALHRTAHEQHFLGGADAYVYDRERGRVNGHPFAYQLWLWSVISYQRLALNQVLWRQKRKMPVEEIKGICYGVQLGEDAKRAIAFLPQSTARGVLTEACFPLFDPEDELADRCYVGDLYYGETPLRAPIHDSLLLEVPTRKVDRLIERVAYAMQRPIAALPCPPEWGMGESLTIGVDAKIGKDWGSMEKLALPSWVESGVSGDTPYTPAEEDDQEDVDELEMPLGVPA